MRMSRINQICIFLFMGIISISCSHNGPTDPDADLPVRGYFKGFVNDEAVDIEQKDMFDTRIGPTFMYYTNTNQDSLFFYSWDTQFTLDNGKRSLALGVGLRHIHVGVYHLVPLLQYEDYAEDVSLKDNTDKDNPKLYKLKAGTTFRVQVDSWKIGPEKHPVLSGRLEGVLYNTKNKNDSIVLKGIQFKVSDRTGGYN